MVTTTINPIQFASQVNTQFLDYQLTAFPLTDPDLAEQARAMLRGMLGRSPVELRNSPSFLSPKKTL